MTRGVGLAAAVVLTAATGRGSGQPPPDPEPTIGLLVRLSDADAEPPSPPVRRDATPGAPLDETATRAVLDRLPAWPREPAPDSGSSLRRDAPPPPRTGLTTAAAFPAPDTGEPPADAGGPLRILRRSPQGDVPLAPYVSVTFSQPMVPIARHGGVSTADLPLRLAPQPAGRWRWVGTRTLVFEPEAERLPMATGYAVEVAAGVRSLSGAPLEDTRGWSFRTPPPRLVRHHPDGGPASRGTLIHLGFDQSVDPAAIVRGLRLRAGGESLEVRLAEPAEVEADEVVSRLVEAVGPQRSVVVRAARPLPAASEIAVEVGVGIPSAEGTRTTEAEQSFRFSTFGPFRVVEAKCWDTDCPPGMSWGVRFENPIDEEALSEDQVTVEPELPRRQLWVSGGRLNILGVGRSRTTYHVTLAADLADRFGQTLGRPYRFDVTVGPAPPSLSLPGDGLVVLDPAGSTRLPVYSVSLAELDVRLLRVEPEDWPAWRAYTRRDPGEGPAEPPGQELFAGRVRVAGDPDEPSETVLDLSRWLSQGRGHVALVVEAPGEDDLDPEQAWIQVTRLGLSAHVDGSAALVWATSLADGRPLEDVDVRLLGDGASARTDGSGTARLALSGASPALVARLGTDSSLLPNWPDWGWRESDWKPDRPRPALKVFSFDDRGVYRPGEELRLKGWLRELGPGPEGDLALPAAPDPVSWRVFDAQGGEVASGQAPVSSLGGFSVSATLPDEMHLGWARIDLSTPQGSDGDTFQVQEFRRPEFEVGASAGVGPHLIGGHTVASVSASYYAGGGLAGAPVTWRVTSRPGRFTPPDRQGFEFGPWSPWWRSSRETGEVRRVEAHGTTDAAGRHRLGIDFESGGPRPWSVEAEAGVRDVNRQSWSARTELLVHPALVYVGLRSPRAFVAPGEAVDVEAIAVDLDGAAVSGRELELVLERLEWTRRSGEWTEQAVEPQPCHLVSAAEPGRCRFEPRVGGSHRVTARVRDSEGRLNESELRVWVSGGPPPPRRDLRADAMTLVPQRREYRAGETARVLVVSPFAPAEGLLTLARSGLLQQERFRMTEATHTLELPIEEGWTPGVELRVDLLGAAPREGSSASRPAFGTASLRLEVPPRERTLAVEVAPREPTLAPGQATVLDLRVRDAAGRPAAGAEAAIVVVDEAVLALTGYRTPDPLSFFYAPRPEGVEHHELREHVLLARPEELSELLGEEVELHVAAPPPPPPPAGFAPQARAMALTAGAGPEPVRVRADLRPLALFAARVVTDADGRARVPVTLPDNLTRYRVMAVAAAGARDFGSDESSLTARLPLMVRPSPPRFLNLGDRFELPVTVQNQTDAALDVDVAVRVRRVSLEAVAGRRVRVPPRDRVEVSFPAAAAAPGAARIEVAAVAGAFGDAAQVELPVRTPATTEAFASYGQLDSGAVSHRVRAPEGVLADFGGLDVTTSSTELQALTDAVLYLHSYPFECAEQLSSRVLGIAALRDVLEAFQAPGLPSTDALRDGTGRDAERLVALQNPDGGFGWWSRGERSSPWVSVHAANALARAAAGDVAVPQQALDRSRDYLRGIEGHLPDDYPEAVRRTIAAYALHVRAQVGDADPAAARALVRRAGIEGLSFEALGWVLPLLASDAGADDGADAVRRHLENRVAETAGAAHFAVDYGDGAHLLLHSSRRADAVVLEALIADQPESDLIPKLAAGLLAQRSRGRWESTQENAFVLLALGRYFQQYERAEPDFTARLWLGERGAAVQEFRGRSTERRRVEIPMREVPGSADLVLAKEGRGRLYYRIGLRYAPEDLVLLPEERGFSVARAYEAVDAPEDVTRAEDGTWHVRAGARVRVRLSLVAPARRYHVALVDPVPAGLEPLNPVLATTGDVSAGGSEVTVYGAGGLGDPGTPGHWGWWRRVWFDHQNLRDDRVEAFAQLLWEGVYGYSYVARATTPGRYVVPPPRAEEMYGPETRGRGASDRLVVE